MEALDGPLVFRLQQFDLKLEMLQIGGIVLERCIQSRVRREAETRHQRIDRLFEHGGKIDQALDLCLVVSNLPRVHLVLWLTRFQPGSGKLADVR